MQPIEPISTGNRGAKVVMALIAAFSLFAVTSMNAQAANKEVNGEVGTVTIAGEYVDFEFTKGFDGGVLRISGPKGYTLTREIPAAADGITADLLIDADRIANQAQQGDSENAGAKGENRQSLPDGQYVYEAVLSSFDGSNRRVSGVFYVLDGIAQKRLPEMMGSADEGSDSKAFSGKSLNTKFLNEDDHIRINDIQTDGYTYLALDEDDPDDGDAGQWAIANNSTVFQIHEGSPGDTGSSGTPRISVTQGGSMGIGTSAPQTPLHVSAGVEPQLRLSSFFFTGTQFVFDKAELFVGPDGLFFQDDDDENIVKFNHTAPTDSLVVTGNGTGMGTNAPSAPLHVQRSDGSAGILVQETSGTTEARELFKLSNNGGPFFIFQNTDISQSYSFAMGATGDFLLSHQQTSGVQFRLKPNGDATFQGDVTANGVQLTSSRETKTDFAPIDEQTVLEKVGALDVSQWRYKREAESERHIGPMAEDFRDVFGLGDGRHISAGDAQGVLFAAAKALRTENATLRSELAQLKAEVAELREETE